MVQYCENGPLIESPLWFHTKGLMQTSTGYGRKLATPYKTRYNGRLYRVYCCCYSNAGTCYIISRGKWLVIRNEERAVA